MGKGQLGGAPSWFKKITDKIRRDISNTQGQNVITYPYYESSKTENGIQFSIRSDGGIKVNGHATADACFKLHSHLMRDGNLTVPFGIYTLSGAPKGGNPQTYFMQVTMSIAGSECGIITDYGNGGIGDIDNGGDYVTLTDAYIGIKICVKSGTTVPDLIFRPMLEKGTASHEYQPTNLTNKTLKNILSGVDNVGNAIADAKKAGTDAQNNLNNHISDKSNPHGVTASQIPSTVTSGSFDSVSNVGGEYLKVDEALATAANNISSIHKKLDNIDGMGLDMFMNDVTEHIANKNNPHAVTKAQVGLGNVPNVATNDQTPTFTAAASRANIVSGEKLSVILGKIMKFFTDLKSVAFSGSYTDLSNIPSTFTPASHTHNYAGSSSAGGSASSLSYFKNTSATDVGIDDTSANAIGYVTGTSSILNQNDGAMYKQVYSGSWAHEIYGDYRTGQIAVRGKNNGTWQAWRKILDSSNYTSYCTPANIGAAAASHTHSYAGSSSAGGSATSAVKLDSSAGSATQPVYFSSGKPVACSYTLGKSVPSNAVFTDTTYNGSNLKTSATKTASNTSSISNSIVSNTALDDAIQTLLNNDKTLDTKSDEVDNKSISTYDANVYYNYGNVVYYEGKVYRHIKVSSGSTPGVKGQVPTNTEYWKEVTVSDLFKELSNASNILSSLTSNDFDYSGGPTQIGAPSYTVNESLHAIADELKKLNSNFSKYQSKEWVGVYLTKLTNVSFNAEIKNYNEIMVACCTSPDGVKVDQILVSTIFPVSEFTKSTGCSISAIFAAEPSNYDVRLTYNGTNSYTITTKSVYDACYVAVR